MKTKSLFFAILLFFFAFTSLPVSAETTPTDGETPEKHRTEEEYKVALDVLTERIEVLKEAKKNASTIEEKQLVKNEIKEIKKEAKALKQEASSNGIYIGAGALIVILLLILLL